MLTGNDVQNAALQAADLVGPEIQTQTTSAVSTLGIHKPFEPEDHDLDPNFSLTKFSEIKTRGTKVPQDVLNNLLKGLKLGNQASNLTSNESSNNHQNQQNIIIPKKDASGHLAITINHKDLKEQKRVELGTDSSITPISNSSLSLIETTNYVYMLVDDPYVMGKIACSNILSNLYALGVTKCDIMLMNLNVSYKLTDKERDTVVPIMIRGFRVIIFY